MRPLSYLIFLLVSTSANTTEAEMNTTMKVAENLQMFIAPVNEDEYESFVKVCGCVAEKAAKSWDKQKFSKFNDALNEYAVAAKESMKNVEAMLTSGPPQPSKGLVIALEEILNFVESCESSHNTKVEF